MCAARCHRSLKRDEEITLWRSLCALGAPLYGNLCISFSPSLSLSVSRLSSSASRSFCRLPLSLGAHLPRRALSSAFYNRILVLLTRSVKHTRHGISPIPSFSLRVFLSSPHTAPSPFFPLDSTSLFLSLTLFQLVRAPLPLPLFPLLVCFPLPVGNCTLSLLPARRFPLVRICRCSPIRFRVFCSSLSSSTASFPPAPFYFTF